MRTTTTATALLGALSFTEAINLDLSSRSSIIAAASTIKDNILALYPSGPGSIPGLFGNPYYFWEDGLAWDSLINYVSHSGDQSIVPTIQDALLFQVGPDDNYMPPNQSKSLGNDDVATWGLAAMTAAEQNFPQREGQEISWLQLAKNVFDEIAARWDTQTCGGGLRWQIFTFNNGYSYKNSVSQGSFALLAARLARYTGNQTYTDWAREAVQWTETIGLISPTYQIFDGTDSVKNCSDFNHIQWTQNSGLFINTGAYLSNATETNTTFLLPMIRSAEEIFARNDVIYEVACQPSKNCNVDQLAFRAPYVRALASARDLANASEGINAQLQASAMGAAAQCSGGENGTTCGTDWSKEEWDGTFGLGQELAALEVILANLQGVPLSTANATSNGTTTAGGNNGTMTGSAPPEMQTTNGANGLAMSMSMALVGLSAVFCVLA